MHRPLVKQKPEQRRTTLLGQSIERSLYKALHELQRVQAARKGKTIPAPAVLDVDLSVANSARETA